METPPNEQVQMTQAAGVIALGNVTSRALGLLREIVKSGLFGAGPHVSALDAAVRIPTSFYDLLVGEMISSALVPVLSDYASSHRREELWGLLNVLISTASLIVCGFLALGELLAPQLAWLIAGGLSQPTRNLTVELLRLLLPAILFLNMAGILRGALYALKRFTLPAFAAAILNATTVAAALALGHHLGVHSMAIGLVAGAILQVVLQIPGLLDARFHLTLNLRHPALRRIGILYLPILIGLLVDSLSVVISYNLASHIDDSAISWMQYAAQIIQFPLGLVAAAVSIAILPTLSRQASAEKVDPFRTTLAQGLRLVLTLVVPATIGLAVLSTPLVALVFEHGGFTPTDTEAVAEALRYHLLGLVFAAVDQLLVVAFYARKDTLTPALVGVGTNVLYMLSVLVLFWMGVLNLPVLILANSCKWAAHGLAMLALTHHRLGGLGKHRLWSLTLKATLASLVMATTAWGAMRTLTAMTPPGLAGELLIVAVAGGAGAMVYILLAGALRLEEISLLHTALTDGLSRLTGLRRKAIIPSPEEAGAGIRLGKKQEAQPVPPDLYDQAYFLTACEGHEEFATSKGRELSHRLKAALAVAGVRPGMRVLDVGCGRGEILRHCTHLGAKAYGIDYAAVAVKMSQQVLNTGEASGVYQADAKRLPFADAVFDRVLLLDIVEHLHPWELEQTLLETERVLQPGGQVIVHTAPNVWYNRYAYPIVRLARTLMGQGACYPKDPRAIIPANLDVHVNEQSALSLWRALRRSGFRGRVWLETPPQRRQESWLFQIARHILFNWLPFRWLFEREVFAVARKAKRL
jgi:putative peptidoglycan lipid II flippase